MKNFLTIILIATLALFGGLAVAGPDQNPLTIPTTNPTRVVELVVPNVQNVPLTAYAGSSAVLSDATLTNGTEELAVVAADSPDSARELVIFQSEASGTALSIRYDLGVTNWDGTETTYTVTLATTNGFALPYAVRSLNAVAVTISGSAASDGYKIGYRGFYPTGAYLDSDTNIIQESVAGLKPSTAGTVTNQGFYLPNSISAGNSLYVALRTTATGGPPKYLGTLPGLSTGTLVVPDNTP